MYDFDKVIERKGTNSIKYDREKAQDPRIIPMWVADMDFETLPEVKEALVRRASHGVFGYAAPTESYYQAVINWMETRHQFHVEKDWIVTTSGVVGALKLAVRALTQKDDAILVMKPVYYPFDASIQLNGRRVIECPLILKENHYECDFDIFEKQIIDHDVKMFILCNPHNPIGKVWTKEELIKVAEICKKNNTILVGDEIHGDIVYGEHKHTPLFSLSDDLTDNIVVMGSPSKTFNLACFYSAYVVIKNKALRDQYNVVYDDFHFDYNYLGIEALMACYNECDYYVDQQNEYFWKNIGVVRDFLAENMPEVKMIEPEGTYLLWIDFSAWNMEQDDLMNAFAEAGVRLNSGTNYGECGKGYVRLNVATQTAVLKKGLECIKVARDSHMA